MNIIMWEIIAILFGRHTVTVCAVDSLLKVIMGPNCILFCEWGAAVGSFHFGMLSYIYWSYSNIFDMLGVL